MSGMKPRTALVGCLAGLLAASAVTAAAGDTPDITYAGGLLTVRCADAGLADVLEQIGSATGMTLVLDDAVKSAVVTVDIEAQPVQAALERLLEGRGVSYAMSLSPDGQKVAQMFVGSGTETRSASAAGGPSRPAAPAAAAHRAPEPPAPAAPHLPLPAIGSDDEEDIDTEADDPSPFAAMAAEGVPGLPTAPAAAAPPAAANARPATQGTPPVPITFPGSSQPYYPVLDPFGRPIPMPQPTPAAPPVEQQKPAAPVNQ
jgi:hypothetical protein